MAVTITIANEKGGVGKTTTAVNLAAGLALRFSKALGPEGRILLVDMDPQGHALLSTAFGQKATSDSESLSALLTETPPPSIQRLIRPSNLHKNLFVILSNHAALVEASRSLPTLMANETRLARALAPIQNQFGFIIIDTPPNTGDLLINSLVAANLVLIPVETSYLGVSGLRELQKTIDQVRMHFRPGLKILGYLPTLCDEQRSEAKEILAELGKRFGSDVLPPIHKSADLTYAHSAHMDVFMYKPPRQRTDQTLESSSRATQEYATLVNLVLERARPSIG